MKKAAAISMLIIGIMILFSVSHPIYMMYRENQIHSDLESKYTITKVAYAGNPLHIRGHTITIMEEAVGAGSDVKLFINGEKISELDNIELNRLPDDKFQGWIGIVKIRHKQDSFDENSQIAIVQRISRQDERNKSDLKWHIFVINESQPIQHKVIALDARGDDDLDIKLINKSGTAAGAPMGYRSDIFYASGNPYATVFPKAFGVIGFIMAIAGFCLWSRRRKSG